MTPVPPDRAFLKLRREIFEERGANFPLPGSYECMGGSFGHQPGRETTRALLEQIAAGDGALRLRRQVLGWNGGATVEQVEEAFQEACVRAAKSCRGQSEGEVYAWLRTTTHHCLGRMRERRDREPIADQPFDDLDPCALCAPGADVAVLEREKRAELEGLTRVVLERLSESQLDVAALHSRGFRRREIAEHLGTSPRAVKRVVEQILTIFDSSELISRVVTSAAGRSPSALMISARNSPVPRRCGVPGSDSA